MAPIAGLSRVPKTDPRAADPIACLFEARSVAVVGSLRKGHFGGYVVARHLLDFGFPGQIYPVNPQHESLLGIEACARVSDIPHSVDLAVIMTAAQAVPQILRDCVENGARVAIIVADGFAERSDEGRGLQREVDAIAGRAGLRLLGPNTIGVANPANGLVTTPYRILYEKLYPGHVALCGQTGIIGPQALPLEDMHYGVSKICDFGNKCDMDEVDLLDYLRDDVQTRVIAMHVEGMRDGRAFLGKLREVVPQKPVVVLKPGRTAESRTAIASHTGTLAGEEELYDGVFRQAGVIRVSTLRELVDVPKVFASQPLPRGNRIAIITISGGAGVMGIDVAAQHGLTLASLSPATMDRLARISPLLAGNPIDMGPALPVYQGGMGDYFREMLGAVVDDESVDLMAVACPYAVRDTLEDVFGAQSGGLQKTVAMWVPSPTLSGEEEVCRQLESMGFPTYRDCESAVRALGAAYQYTRSRSRLAGETI